jgi:hypothetical protein
VGVRLLIIGEGSYTRRKEETTDNQSVILDWN